MFNPKLILQQVWEGRAPKAWRVFTGKKRVPNVGGPLAFVIFLIGIFVLPQSASSVAVADVGLSASYLFMLLLLMIVGGAIGLLTQRVMVKLNRNPAPTLVILPEGVIEYVNWQTSVKGLFFARVAHMQSRYSREEDGRLMQYLEIQAHDEFVGGWVPPADFALPSPIVTCIGEFYCSYTKKQYRDNFRAENQQVAQDAGDLVSANNGWDTSSRNTVEAAEAGENTTDKREKAHSSDEVVLADEIASAKFSEVQWDASVFGGVASFCNIVLADDVEGSTLGDDARDGSGVAHLSEVVDDARHGNLLN